MNFNLKLILTNIIIIVMSASRTNSNFLESIFKFFDCEIEFNFIIYGGKIPKADEFPFSVFIEIYRKSFRSTCGGAIIKEDWVLSAAHCVTGRDGAILLTAGAVNLKNTKLMQKRRGKRVIIHNNYQHYILGKDDICLIQTESPYHFTNEVNQVLIAATPWLIDTTKECLVGGWGQTETNKHPENMRVIQILAQRGLSACPCTTLEEVMKIICAVSQDKTQNVCLGDSGNPLICDGKLFGITHMMVEKTCSKTNFTNRALKCIGNVYGTFLHVQLYKDWISTSINNSEKIPLIISPERNTASLIKITFLSLLLSSVV